MACHLERDCQATKNSQRFEHRVFDLTKPALRCVQLRTATKKGYNMSAESREENVLGNFHRPSSDEHPAQSIGNMQIWGPGGGQVGSIEFIPNTQTQSLDLELYNTGGDAIAPL